MAFDDSLEVRRAVDQLLVFPRGEAAAPEPAADEAMRAALDGLSARIALFASARSGSEYLCRLMGDLGVDAREWLNPDSKTADGASIKPGEDERAFLTRLAGTVPNRVLCVKGGVHRFMSLVRVGEWPAGLARWRFIHLRRRNVVLQAISALIAKETGAWRSFQPATAKIDEAALSFSAIAKMTDQIFRSDDAATRFLAVFQLERLNLYYEDIVANPRAAAEQVKRFCGLDGENLDLSFLARRQPPMVQRTDMSLEIEAAFRRRLEAGMMQP